MLFRSEHESFEGHLASSITLPQCSLEQGAKGRGEPGKGAASSEMKQRLSLGVLGEMGQGSMTQKEKNEALPILLFLAMKRGMPTKGRACAGGRKQRHAAGRNSVPAPAASTAALFYTLMAGAMEERGAATAGLPGHFLQAGAPKDERAALKVAGVLALVLAGLGPAKWKKHLRKEKGAP